MRIRLPGCPNTFRIGEDIVLPLPANNVLAPAPNAPPGVAASRHNEQAANVRGSYKARQWSSFCRAARFRSKTEREQPPGKPNGTEPALQYPPSAPENMDITTARPRSRKVKNSRNFSGLLC